MKNRTQFNLGPLGSLNQVVKALGKTIRAMADGTISTADGARICNGLGIMRTCLEEASLERLEERLGHLERGGKDGYDYGHTPRYRSAIAPH
jgi:hypothetical protein